MYNLSQLSQKYNAKQLAKIINHTPNMQHCVVCSNVFDAQSYHLRVTAIYPYTRKCCNKCRYVYPGSTNRKYSKNKVCSFCSKKFTSKRSKPKQKFCSHICYSSSRKGVSNHSVRNMWKEGRGKLPKGSISNAEKKWLTSFPNITHTQHKITLENRAYVVDGFDQSSNTIYEYLGSYWHGNPEVYQSEDYNKRCKKTFGELYRATMKRITTFKQHGYNVVIQWSKR